MSDTTHTEHVGSLRTRVVSALLILVAAAALLYAVGQILLSVNPGAVHLDPGLAQPARANLDVGDLPAGANVDVPPTVRLDLADPGLVLRLLVHAPEVVGGVAVAIAALLLRRVTRRIGAGTPFAPGTASAIGWIAALVLLVGALVPLASDLATAVVLDNADLADPGGPFTLGITLPLLPFALAALVLFVADAWRRGTAMHEELEGLV